MFPSIRCGVSCWLAVLVLILAAIPKALGSSSTDAVTVHPGFTTRQIRAAIRGVDGRELALTGETAKPVSLAGGDFNRDGFPDLVAGYAVNDRGLLTVHMASKEAFAPQSSQTIRAIAQGEFPPAFAGTSTAIPIPVGPDILEVGDFNGDGNVDILFAAQGGDHLYILPGDGSGNFGAPRVLSLPGRITALTTATFGIRGSGANVVVGVLNGSGATLLVYCQSLTASPTSYAFGSAIDSLAIGDLDGDQYRDVAIAAGGRVYILGNSGF